MVVVSPAAAKEKKEGPTSGGDSAGNMTLRQLYILPLMPLCYLHLPIYHIVLQICPFFMLYCLYWGYEWRSYTKKKTTTFNWTENILLSLPSPLCAGLYLMYI